jgi:hypothetical protein
LAFALVACAAGPVLPRQTQSSKYDKVELIAYRALTRDDFRAEVAVGFTIVEERRSRVQRLLAQPSSPTKSLTQDTRVRSAFQHPGRRMRPAWQASYRVAAARPRARERRAADRRPGLTVTRLSIMMPRCGPP